MSEPLAKVEQDRQAILDAKAKGPIAVVGTYTRLSGPGWLQSALTLGGGSLASSLFLGVLAGFSLLWLQPIAMILGIIMLSAIGYIAMCTKERPFQAINRHINPVLGWGWALASLAANMVWCLPQYSLAAGVLQKNLMPGQLGEGSAFGLQVGTWIQTNIPWLLTDAASASAEGLSDFGGKVIISASILLITLMITWTYDAGGWGVKLYELLLKLVVAGIVACFVGVVVVLSMAGTLDWQSVWAGFIPDFTKIWEPSASYQWLLDAIPDQATRDYWSGLIVAKQRDVMISAAATAVGINMTFLLPYSMLRRGWGKEFRGLAKFDLSTGMFIPFVLATSCVVMAAATQFHPMLCDYEMPVLQAENGTAESGTIKHVWAQKDDFVTSDQAVLVVETEEGLSVVKHPYGGKITHIAVKVGDEVEVGTTLFSLHPSKAALSLVSDGDKKKFQDGKLKDELGNGEFLALQAEGEEAVAAKVKPLTEAEIRLAAHLKNRNSNDLSSALAPLTGKVVANYVFGIGVVGMTLSSITLLMLISGFVICEIFGVPPKGWPNRLGTLAAATGVLGPFLWAGEARFWLAVPTSVFCFILLPFAYLTFFFAMNSKGLLGEDRPRGLRRFCWNIGMGVAASVATAAAISMVWVKCRDTAMDRWNWPYGGYAGMGLVGAVVLLIVFVHFVFPRKGNGEN